MGNITTTTAATTNDNNNEQQQQQPQQQQQEEERCLLLTRTSPPQPPRSATTTTVVVDDDGSHQSSSSKEEEGEFSCMLLSSPVENNREEETIRWRHHDRREGTGCYYCCRKVQQKVLLLKKEVLIGVVSLFVLCFVVNYYEFFDMMLMNNQNNTITSSTSSTGTGSTGTGGVITTITTTPTAVATEEKKKTIKPTLVLHVGLHKTGTTYLQNTLSLYSDITNPILALDNFTYLGTAGFSQHQQFITASTRSIFQNVHAVKASGFCQKQDIEIDIDDQHTTNNNNNINSPAPAKTRIKYNPQFVKIVNRHVGSNALLVYEGLSCHYHAEAMQSLRNFLKRHWANIQISVAYRPLGEWIVSWYNQAQKRRYLKDWPENGGPLAPSSFDDMASEFIATLNITRKHPAQDVGERYELYFDQVSILPLQQVVPSHRVRTKFMKNSTTTKHHHHVVNGLLEYMFCRNYLIVPTPNICEAVHRGEFDNGRTNGNPSINLDYDALAVAVHNNLLLLNSNNKNSQKIKIIRNMKRRVLRNRIMMYHRQNLNNSDYPRICTPQNKLVELEELSWDMEEHLFFPDDDARRKQHRDSFQKLVNNFAFCIVDSNATLQLPEWKSFIDSIM